MGGNKPAAVRISETAKRPMKHSADPGNEHERELTAQDELWEVGRNILALCKKLFSFRQKDDDNDDDDDDDDEGYHEGGAFQACFHQDCFVNK